MDHQDTKYIDALKSGDKRGIREIYDKFFPGIQSLITRHGGNAEDAQDIFQDSLIVIFEKLRMNSFQLSSSFYTLLYGICRNLWGNRLQKRSRTDVSLSDDLTVPVGDDLRDLIHQEEKRQIFWHAFKKLGKDCQQLLQLFFEKTSMEEIATIMGYASEGYAKKRKFHCKSQLVLLVQQDPMYHDYTQYA